MREQKGLRHPGAVGFEVDRDAAAVEVSHGPEGYFAAMGRKAGVAADETRTTLLNPAAKVFA
jgi:hypothetical protein